jgi:hypothetical protein
LTGLITVLSNCRYWHAIPCVRCRREEPEIVVRIDVEQKSVSSNAASIAQVIYEYLVVVAFLDGRETVSSVENFSQRERFRLRAIAYATRRAETRHYS